MNHSQLRTRFTGGYEAKAECQAEVDEVYAALAQLVHAVDVGEVAFAENATRAYDYLLHTVTVNSHALKDAVHADAPVTPSERALIGRDSVLITTACEYGSNYTALLQVSNRTGASLRCVRKESSGVLSLAHLQELLEECGDRVALVSLCWVPTNGGLVQPAAEVGALCKKYNVLYLLDACQAVGQIDVDVQHLQCDALVTTARKFLRGPRGMGFMYVRRGSVFARAEPIFLDLATATLRKPTPQRSQGSRTDVLGISGPTGTALSGLVESGLSDGDKTNVELQLGEKDVFDTDPRPARRYENWERNYAAWLGLGEAARYALSIGLPKIEQRVRFLGGMLRSTLNAIDIKYRVVSRSAEHSAVPSQNIEMPEEAREESAVQVMCLGEAHLQCGIVSFVVNGLSATQVKDTLSETYAVKVSVSPFTSTFRDMNERGLCDVVRASVHYFNTEQEVRYFAECVRQIAEDANHP
ncbi:hypothetical protein SARC_01714 [Sphaeroforma arctica JP610]|uniref:Aminotransferase class V domain-containing protein n=1 Tax=Sphaeroforma arctica JP610 TaxID=667725 RepID=A0A0L0GAY1_9EUKA|nr:hypothetical protein SARC_01714 [Sphaeroforma arctica JP610]KNC86145.1 hypothetical protein SARC_01714 [Sphaeroforma arctica JP610]|eukprot:XP_014160047.1 hypothetical protein SARC_01714 [Sphaeroforma arctica JP610]